MKRTLLSTLLFSGLFAISAVIADEAAQTPATLALDWLATVDKGEYSTSWEGASPLFQAGVTQDQWNAALNTYRAPLGAVKSRTLSSETRHDSLPGAPAGEYILQIYTSEFTEGAASQETLTLMKVGDDWLVSGYFIK